jgi:hypothetical protein
LRFLRSFATSADGPKETFEIGSRHANAVVAHRDLLPVYIDIDPVAVICRINTVAKGLNSDGIHGVLDVLPDKRERRFVNLLRDRAQHAFEVDSDFE